MGDEYAIALSRFGLTWDSFLDLTPKEFYLALRDQIKKEEEQVMAIVRPICETIRMSALYFYNTQMTKERYMVKVPKKLFVFPWEVDKLKDPQTLTEMKNVLRMIALAPVGSQKLKSQRKRKRGKIRKRLEDYG